MKLKSIRRMITRQAGGRNKLGWFSWSAAIFGAGVVVVATVAVLYQLASNW